MGRKRRHGGRRGLREAGAGPTARRSSCQTQPRPRLRWAPLSFAEQGNSTTGNKTALRDGGRGIGACLPSCNPGLVLEEKHVSLVSESFEPLGAQRWIFFHEHRMQAIDPLTVAASSD